MTNDKPAGYWDALYGFLGIQQAQRTTPQPARCPHCNQPMIASTPAADPAPEPVEDPPAETWRDRPPLA